MKSIYLTTSLLITLLMLSCASTQKSSNVWVNTEKIAGKQFSKVFIVVLTADVEARAKLENDLAFAAHERGYTVIKSIDVMPPTLSNSETPSKEMIVDKVKSSGCDAVFVASLLKQEENVQYTPGSTAYSIGANYSWHGNLYGYYSHWYPSVSTPGYYTKEKNYFMQSNLYETTTEEIMWSVQSKVFNPTSLSKFSNSYTTTLIKQLDDARLLKK